MANTRLINSTDQLKAVMGQVWNDLNFDAFCSFVDDAELTFTIPAIGMTLFNALLGDGLSDTYARALLLLQKAEANFAISSYVAFGAVQITEAGITVVKDARLAPASDKKTYMLQQQSRFTGFVALEAAISFLEANLNSIPEYANSPEHQLNRRFYVNTTAAFSLGYDIRGNSELFDSLKTCINRIEENYIDPILGNTISEALRTAILNGTTSDLQNQLLTRIQKAVAPLTIADAIPFRMIVISENGLLTSTIKHNIESVQETTEATVGQLQAVMNRAQAVGESEIGKLKVWLINNAGSFPGLVLPDPEAASKINFTSNFTDRGIYYI